MADKVFYGLKDIPVVKAKREWEEIRKDCAAVDIRYLREIEGQNAALGIANRYNLFSDSVFSRRRKS